MSLQVIGAGFGRTGTRSLKEALEMLGLAPCHHMMEVFLHPEQAAFWDRAAQGETMKWDELFHAYKSACDWPSCSFYKELMAQYPKAKVILSLRDSKSWFKSVSSTIMPAMKKREAGPDGKPMGPGLPGIFAPLLIGEKTFGNDFSEAHMIEVYERHNEEVKRTVPADRLLVFQASDGWEPLCKFLGIKVPEAPYPKMNTTDEFQARAGLRPAAH